MGKIFLLFLFLNTPHLWAIEPCQDYKCDSLAVRAILENNGWGQVGVKFVTQINEIGRIEQLRLDSKQLTTLPADIGKLNNLFFNGF